MGHTLVIRDLVPSLVDTREAEIARLPHRAVLGAIDEHGGVAGSGELCAVSVVDF
jgi:hypothetical protein